MVFRIDNKQLASRTVFPTKSEVITHRIIGRIVLNETAKKPTRGTNYSAGYDLYASVDETITLAVDAVNYYLKNGIRETMNTFNKKSIDEKGKNG